MDYSCGRPVEVLGIVYTAIDVLSHRKNLHLIKGLIDHCIRVSDCRIRPFVSDSIDLSSLSKPF